GRLNHRSAGKQEHFRDNLLCADTVGQDEENVDSGCRKCIFGCTYTDLQRRLGLPPLSRLWAIAQYQRNHRLARLADDDLLDLVVETLVYCVERFDEQHPPKEGLCRRGTDDRFTYFFTRKLIWELTSIQRGARELKRKRERGRFRGPRAE